MATEHKIMIVDRDNCLRKLGNTNLILGKESKSFTCFTVLKDNSRLLTGDEGGRIHMWCLKNYELVKCLKADYKVFGIHEVSSLKQFVATFNSDVVKIYGTEDFIIRNSVKLKYIPYYSKISENEEAVLFLNKNANCILCSSENLNVLFESIFHNDAFNVFDFCVEKNLVIFGTERKVSYVYSLYNSIKNYERYHEAPVTCVCILSRNNAYVIGESSGQVTVFGTSNYETLAKIYMSSYHIIKIADLPEINQLILASGDKTIARLEKSEYNNMQRIHSFKHQVKSFQVFDAFNKILCSMADGSLQVLDVETGKKLGEFYPFSSRIRKFYANSLNGYTLYSLDMHKNFNEWRLEENKVRNLMSLHDSNITSMHETKKNLVVSLRNLIILVIKNN